MRYAGGRDEGEKADYSSLRIAGDAVNQAIVGPATR